MDYFPVVVYWGGEISHKEVDVVYNGGVNSIMFIHRQHTTFEVFVTKVYDVVGCDRNSYELKMEMKYPVTGKNVVVPIRNDESISALAYAASQALGTAMEVYVELVPKLDNARGVMCSMELPESGPSVRHDTFTESCVAWRSRCPLICFDIVEFHMSDRVMRQFGLEQPIPDACDTQATLHAIDRRTADKNFPVRLRSHIDAWNDRESTIVQGENYTGQSLGMYMAWYRQITILRLTNPTYTQPTSHYHPTATILAERIKSVLLQCSDATHGASALPDDVGYRLCTQTLGSINASLTEVLTQTGYDYLIPTRPTDDDTLHTPARGSAHRASSSRGSSRGFGRSSVRGRSSGSPSSSTSPMSPFVPPGPGYTPPHPSPPNPILTYQRASQRRPPSLDAITEADESTPTSTTGARSKRGRGI